MAKVTPKNIKPKTIIKEVEVNKYTKICTMQYSQKCKDAKGQWSTSDAQINKNYYKVKRISPFYNEKDEYTPMCRHCLNEYIYDIKRQKKELIELCKILDIPFIEAIFQSGGVNSIGKYLGGISGGHKGKTFKDSVIEDEEKPMIVQKEEEVSGYYKKWGKGFVYEDYQFLEAMYDEMTHSYVKPVDFGEKAYWKEICFLSLELHKSRLMGEDTSKVFRSLDSAMKSANLQPTQQTATEEGVITLGETIKRLEENAPPFLVESEWQDFYDDIENIGAFAKEYVEQLTSFLGMSDWNEDDFLNEEDEDSTFNEIEITEEDDYGEIEESDEES